VLSGGLLADRHAAVLVQLFAVLVRLFAVLVRLVLWPRATIRLGYPTSAASSYLALLFYRAKCLKIALILHTNGDRLDRVIRVDSVRLVVDRLLATPNLAQTRHR
jgi:hypothetical protein